MLKILVGVTAGLWTMTALCRPRRPTGMNETQWLVWSRLMGGWERLRLAAFISLLGVLLIASLTLLDTINADLRQLRDPCYFEMSYFPLDDAAMLRELRRGGECH